MDPITFNRLGNIRHEEIVAWSEQQQQPGEPRWKFPNLFALIRRAERQEHVTPPQTRNFDPCAPATDC